MLSSMTTLIVINLMGKFKDKEHRSLRYIDTHFLGRQNHDNQIDAKFEKNLVHYIEFGCLLLNE